MKVYIVFDGDHIGRMVGRATLADMPEEVRVLSQRIDQGNGIFKMWCESVGGSVINIGGDEGRLEVDASRLGDLPNLRDQYEKCVGATCTVGVGMALSLAQKSLVAGKARGGDRIVFYGPEVDMIIADLREKPEGEKIADEYLNKADVGSGGLAAQHRLVGAPAGDNSEVDVLMSMLENEGQPNPEQAPQAAAEPSMEDLQNQFHKLAGANDLQTRPPASVSDATKAKIVGIIEFMQKHPEQLQLLKIRNPDIYNSLNQLVSAMIEMARKASPLPMAKSEDGVPAAKECKHFFGKGSKCLKCKADKELVKAALEAGKTGRHAVILPVGTTKEPAAGSSGRARDIGKRKIQTSDGKEHWVSVRAGIVMSPQGQATSSRNPSGIKPKDGSQ